MKLWYLTIIAFPLFFIGNAIANEDSYACQVVHIYALTEGAMLEKAAHENELKGSSFSVSRVTGKIIGSVIPTTLAKSTWVINQGSKDNSFKAIAEFDKQVQVIEIQEFRSGPIKPFVASSMGGAGIVTGTCK